MLIAGDIGGTKTTLALFREAGDAIDLAQKATYPSRSYATFDAIDFGPTTAQEAELGQYLDKKFQGHVSWERVLSGPGFYNLYTFLRDSGRERETPALAQQLAQGDPNVTISALGMAGADLLCSATVELFCSIYGAEAGNVALRCVAVGGVYLGGGIAPKLLPALRKESFARVFFCAKGRFGDFLREIPVRVALNAEAPVIGAAHFARRL